MAQFMKIMACRNVGSPLFLLPPLASSFISFQHFAPFQQLPGSQAVLYDLHATDISIRVNQRNQHYCCYYTPQSLSQRVNFSFRHEGNVFLYSSPLAKAASEQLNNYVYAKNYNKIITALLTPMYLRSALGSKLTLSMLLFRNSLADFVESLPSHLR